MINITAYTKTVVGLRANAMELIMSFILGMVGGNQRVCIKFTQLALSAIAEIMTKKVSQ